jgi:hypothetical protein
MGADAEDGSLAIRIEIRLKELFEALREQEDAIRRRSAVRAPGNRMLPCIK